MYQLPLIWRLEWGHWSTHIRRTYIVLEISAEDLIRHPTRPEVEQTESFPPSVQGRSLHSHGGQSDLATTPSAPISSQEARGSRVHKFAVSSSPRSPSYA